MSKLTAAIGLLPPLDCLGAMFTLDPSPSRYDFLPSPVGNSMSTADIGPVLAGIEPSIVRAMVVGHTNCSDASGRRAPRLAVGGNSSMISRARARAHASEVRWAGSPNSRLRDSPNSKDPSLVLATPPLWGSPGPRALEI